MDISLEKNPELFSTESRAAAVIVGVIVLLLIPSVAVALRFYTRRVLTGRVSYDDWMSLVALNFGFACGITIAYMTHVGLGHHIGTISQSGAIREYLEAFYLSIIFYNAGVMVLKLCFLAMYYRAMKSHKWRKVVAFVSVLVFAWEATQVFATMVFCKPLSGSNRVKCTQYLPGWYQNTLGNIIFNIIIFLLPIPMLRSMKLPKAQKIALAVIFSLGIFTVAVSILRLKFLGRHRDTTFDNADAAVWSLCEISMGLTCACLPTLRPLAARYLSRYFSYQISYQRPVMEVNRHGKAIPPPLRLHQRPIWYGADSGELGLDTKGMLRSGNITDRRVPSATVVGDDYYDEEQRQQVLALDSPKGAGHTASLYGPRNYSTRTPRRPSLPRMFSTSSHRQISYGGHDETEIIVIGLQCVSPGESQDCAGGDGGGIKQPVSVYRGWRPTSEVGPFGPQQHRLRETTTSIAIPEVPAAYWDEGRNVPQVSQYHLPDSPVNILQSDNTNTYNNNIMDTHPGNDFERGAPRSRWSEDMSVVADIRGRNNINNRVRNLLRWRRY